LQKTQRNFLSVLTESAKTSIAQGYYSVKKSLNFHHTSLLEAIKRDTTPIIAEVKFISPAEGRLRSAGPAEDVAIRYECGGASAISVITEPKHFGGNLNSLAEVKSRVKIPVLMKDIIIDRIQVEAGRRLGADAVLLIMGVFQSGLANSPLTDLISYSHSLGLEVLLEVHDEEEYIRAAKTDADLIGINNRNLMTLETSLATTEKLLAIGKPDKPVVSESGFKDRSEIERFSKLGIDAFLVGSTLMKADDPLAKLRELKGE
jgi:indole-3-glycerol phosphate synthase